MPREQPAVVGAEPGGGVVHRQAEHDPRVEAADAGDRAPAASSSRGSIRPARTASRSRGRRPARPARPASGSTSGSCERSASISIMHVVAVGEPVAEPGAVRGAEPRLRPPPQHLDVAELVARASRRARRCRRGCRRRSTSMSASGTRAPDSPQHLVDVLDLVVRGDHHEDAHGGRAYRPHGCELLHGHRSYHRPMTDDPEHCGRATESRDETVPPMLPSRGVPPRVPARRHRRPASAGSSATASPTSAATPTRPARSARCVGAMIAAGGVGIVAVLVLRAMSEWRRTAKPARWRARLTATQVTGALLAQRDPAERLRVADPGGGCRPASARSRRNSRNQSPVSTELARVAEQRVDLALERRRRCRSSSSARACPRGTPRAPGAPSSPSARCSGK